jgi:poly(A) polymerase
MELRLTPDQMKGVGLVQDVARAAGMNLYLTGGAIRDIISGFSIRDLDFTVQGNPLKLQKEFEKAGARVTAIEEDIRTIFLALPGNARAEVSMARTERFEKTGKPPIVMPSTIHEDLRRRDFTVNAMALSVTGTPVFTDPFGGLGDRVKLVLATPAPPEESFADDPLRMLRAARFVSTLGARVAPDVEAAMRDMAGELSRITVERVQAELTKLLLGAHPRAGFELLVDTGLADVVLPEIPALRMAADEHGQHKDVYAHTLQVLEQAIDLEPDGPDLTLRWAALLHDIGKPATRAFLPGGRVSFHHHEVVGRNMARKRLRELRYAKQLVDDVARLVFLHLRFYGYREGEWTDSAVRRYVVDAGPLLPRLHRLVRSDCTTRNRRKAAALSAAYDALEERIADLQAREELAAIRPDLDGNEIMAILGIPPGPLVGQAYRHLLALRMEHGPLGHDRAVEELTRWYAANR